MYSGAKPKFCSSCGNALSVLGKNQKNYVIHEDINIEEDPSEFIDLNNMNGLSVEIEPFQKDKITIGSLMESTSDAPVTNEEMTFPTRNGPQVSTDQVIQQFEREAGTLRQNKDA
jgi:hypothetical protein